MDEKRTERFTVNLTPATLAKLDAYAADHRWSRSTAIAELIESWHPPGWDYPDPKATP
jgi:metal-responsive CopG/Arc/MetJ family transcriptional regulator